MFVYLFKKLKEAASRGEEGKQRGSIVNCGRLFTVSLIAITYLSIIPAQYLDDSGVGDSLCLVGLFFFLFLTMAGQWFDAAASICWFEYCTANLFRRMKRPIVPTYFDVKMRAC